MQQYNTRIQLKSDTETNWNNTVNFIPLNGEFIIYAADNTHPYCRLKVGDGATNVKALPFIDSGTINGEEVEIVKLDNYNLFPTPGSTDKLYIDLETNRIYHYDSHSGYTQLSNFSFTVTPKDVSKITSWKPGVLTNLTLNQNTLKIINGQLPELLYQNTEVVGNITRG